MVSRTRAFLSFIVEQFDTVRLEFIEGVVEILRGQRAILVETHPEMQ